MRPAGSSLYFGSPNGILLPNRYSTVSSPCQVTRSSNSAARSGSITGCRIVASTENRASSGTVVVTPVSSRSSGGSGSSCVTVLARQPAVSEVAVAVVARTVRRVGLVGSGSYFVTDVVDAIGSCTHIVVADVLMAAVIVGICISVYAPRMHVDQIRFTIFMNGERRTARVAIRTSTASDDCLVSERRTFVAAFTSGTRLVESPPALPTPEWATNATDPAPTACSSLRRVVIVRTPDAVVSRPGTARARSFLCVNRLSPL